MIEHAHDVGTLAAYVSRFHPALVHFPIALLPAAALADLLSRRCQTIRLESAARYGAILGAIGALAAAPLGWLAVASTNVPYEPTWLIAVHQWTGISATVLGVISAVAGWRHSQTNSTRALRLFRASLYPAALAALAAGHFGGLLVHGVNYYAW